MEATPSRRRNDLGPAGERVRAKIKAVRKQRGLSTVDLSNRLTHIGRPIVPTGITKIENGDRRVDVGDLVALSEALNCSVIDLLFDGPESSLTTEERSAFSAIRAMRQFAASTNAADAIQALTDARQAMAFAEARVQERIYIALMESDWEPLARQPELNWDEAERVLLARHAQLLRERDDIDASLSKVHSFIQKGQAEAASLHNNDLTDAQRQRLDAIHEQLELLVADREEFLLRRKTLDRAMGIAVEMLRKRRPAGGVPPMRGPRIAASPPWPAPETTG